MSMSLRIFSFTSHICNLSADILKIMHSVLMCSSQSGILRHIERVKVGIYIFLETKY